MGGYYSVAETQGKSLYPVSFHIIIIVATPPKSGRLSTQGDQSRSPPWLAGKAELFSSKSALTPAFPLSFPVQRHMYEDAETRCMILK
jgi:hypothetical protein